MSWILTYTGKRVDLLDPKPEQIDPRDIAHALAHLCRFTGHCTRYHSVAEHSIGVMHHVPSLYRLPALLHDATEAYLGDVSRPLKAVLPDYREIERHFEQVIRQRFGLYYSNSEPIKYADMQMLAIEREVLMPEGDDEWPCLQGINPASRLYVGLLAPKQAEAAYMHYLTEFGLLPSILGSVK